MTSTKLFFRFNSISIILITTLLYSCSQTDEVDEPIDEEDFVPFEISVIAKNSENIYQLDILGDTADILETNLSQTLDIPYNSRRTYTNGSKITFFDIQNGNYAFWQKDVVTGQSISQDPICEATENESWRYPLTSGDQIGLITYEFNESTEKNYLKIFDATTNTCNRFEIADFYIPQNNYAHLHKGRFYLYFTEIGGEAYSLKIMNTSNGEQIETLSFESAFSTTMDDEKLYLMFVDGTYKILNLEDLSLLEEGMTNNPHLSHTPGLYSSNINQNKMVFNYSYPQPAALSSAPAIYDWTTNEITHGGDFYLFDVDRKLEDKYIEGFKFTAVEVDLESTILVAGYQNVRDTNEGGIVYLTFEGEILMDIPLDYVPTEIIIRD